MRKNYRFLRAGLTKLVLASSLLFASTQSEAQTIYGLSNGNLVRFTAANPSSILQSSLISGITAGQSIAGMDFRPLTGELYALGYNSSNGESQLYKIALATGAATVVNATPVVLALGNGKVSFDFNPTVDRIRVVGSNNSNYRLNPISGAIAATDLTINYAAGDVNAGTDPSVGAVAYTNSYAGATSTTLYDVDDSLAILATQNPPNNGALNTLGSLGVSINLSDPSTDLDIYFDAIAYVNKAYFTANTTGSSIDNLYTVNLATGAATLVGSTGIALDDIACFIYRVVPSNVKGFLVYGLTSTNNLISFDSNVPSIVRTVVPVTGVTVGQTLVGMDSRPMTGELYGLGYNSGTQEAQVYKINATTAVATAVNATPVTLSLGTGRVSFDFNPTVDRIRVVGSNNSNYRLNPITGAIAATDLNINYAAGDVNNGATPAIATSAYVNSYAGATATTLYNIDYNLNVLTTQNPPNNGTLNTVGSTGLALNTADPSSDLDIVFNGNTYTNAAFLSANTGSSLNDNLYTVNTTTGATTLVGTIGYGIALKDIACFIYRVVPSNVKGFLVYGLTSTNNLISFDSNVPSIVRTVVPVTGVTVGQVLVGMDSRPMTGELYGLGYNSGTQEAQVYKINATTAVATAVNVTPVTLSLGTGRVSFDFNPTVDRIRVVGSNNSNYRLNPITGAIAATDLNINYAAGDVNNGATPAIATSAYVNSYAGATATTLYNIDYNLNVLTTQNPPNNGTLNTVGSTGLALNTADPSSDLDIVFNGNTYTNAAFLSANTGSSLNDNLYTVNTTTGATTLVGTIGYGIAVKDIACFIYRVVPSSVKGVLVYGLTSTSNLVSFDSNVPSIIRTVVPVTGVTAGQVLVGMDMRPVTKQLYALGYNSLNGESQLYIVNTSTGVATAVNTTPVVLALGTGNIGMDFNPTVDRIRIVGINDANYRLNPLTGAIAATDLNINYAAGDVNAGADPSVSSVAYTNSFPGSTSTTLYDYDDVLNVIATQNPPNNGSLNTIGSSGITLNAADATADLDIFYNSSSASNLIYLAANPGSSSFDNLYIVDAVTGTATSSGAIGYGVAVKDIAVTIVANSANSIVAQTNSDDLRIEGSVEFNSSVYPNPAQKGNTVYVGFELKENTIVNIVVTDVAGRTVADLLKGSYAAGIYEADWNTQSMNTGVYFVQVHHNNHLYQTMRVAIK